MQIVEFNKDETLDRQALKILLDSRDIRINNFDLEMPKIGFMCVDTRSGDAIAAGFLRQLEGTVGIIDSFITDPAFSPSVRSEALDMITKALVDKAKSLKLQGLIAYTTDNNTIERSLRHGFKKLPHTTISLTF